MTSRPWADSPRETAGALVSQAAESKTTDSIRGDVSAVVVVWGRRDVCPDCGRVSWIWERVKDTRCVSCGV